MLASDLTTLTNVKYWLQGNGTDTAWQPSPDAQLGLYITAASRAMLSYLQRASLLQTTFNEIRDGVGGTRLTLRNYPVLSISSLYIGGQQVLERPSLISSISTTGTGFVLSPWDGLPPGKPQTLSVDGFCFDRGIGNINVTYTAGYVIQNEAQSVPSSSVFTLSPLAPYGRYAQDQGVTYAATGVALTKVTSAPTVGQYVAPAALPTTLSNPAPAPSYTFSSADAGAAVLLNYSFVPYDLDQACAKWVGEWWMYRTRIGEKSKALPGGQGTSSFNIADMPDDVKLILNPYRRVLPI